MGETGHTDARSRVPQGKQHHLANAERDAEAARLLAAGLSYRQAAERLGVTHTTVAKMEKRALQRVVLPSVQELRQVECAKLDRDEAALQAIVDDPPVVVSGGRVTDVLDMDAVSKAIDVRTRLAARRAKLLGLDAPVVRVKVSERVLASEIRRIAAELGLVDPSQEQPESIPGYVMADLGEVDT